MKLKKFLQITAQIKPHKNILEQSIGDGILYNQNSIFYNIRKTSIALGYSYTMKDALTLSMAKFILLDDIKNKKTVTYLPNIKILNKLELENPNRFTTQDLIFLGKSFNPVFHESCHMICHEILTSKKIHSNDPKKDFALKANLEEAFTDTAECLVHLTEASEAEKFSIQLNLYRKEVEPDDIKFLKFLIKKQGFNSVATLMMLVSLQVHFMKEELTPKDILLIKNLINWPNTKSQHFESYCKWIFMLMKSEMTPFRAQAADFYFKLHGFKGGHSQALAFDPVAFILQHKAQYLDVLQILANAILGKEEKETVSPIARSGNLNGTKATL